MTLRSPRERALQTICYELGGLLLAAPLYALVTGTGSSDGFLMIAALAVAVMIWSPIHNTVWDMVEFRRTGRVASERPQAQRILHAVSHELTTVFVTLPLLMWLGGHGFWAALVLDVGLTVFYTAYAYLFHIAYDRLRPVRPFGMEVRP